MDPVLRVNAVLTIVLVTLGSCAIACAQEAGSFDPSPDLFPVAPVPSPLASPVPPDLSALSGDSGLGTGLGTGMLGGNDFACDGPDWDGTCDGSNGCCGLCRGGCWCNAARVNGSATGGDNLDWLDSVKVGYDSGFVIASQRQQDLKVSRYPFRLVLNGWGQLRHTASDIAQPNDDTNQFQLKRGRLIFSGGAFNPYFSYLLQFDGRSSSGDDVRLLDYYLSYDFGADQFGLDPGTLGFRTGKYKMPFTMARWLSGRQFEFADRSVASTFFDVNRSFAWGLYGKTDRTIIPIVWETAIFNGLVTGGAETGSSGSLDDNFAYSMRVFGFPIGDWGNGELADFEYHDRLAMRCGFGIAQSQIDRSGSTEFSSVRVVDSGRTLASILPLTVANYDVALYSIDTSFKRRGWSMSMEYYFRSITNIDGAAVPDLRDHGFWMQLGCFVVPDRVQLLTRWSYVSGDSGTLGVTKQSSDEVAGALAWYFKENHAKVVFDITRLNGAPINSAALDISPRDRGWLFRSQIQFSF